LAWYSAGTVSVTNNSTAVTGAGTAWADNVDAGQAFIGPDGLPYEIVSVVSATSLTLASPYRGANASGQAYRIMPVQGYLRDLATQAASLVLSFATVRDGVGQGKFPDGTVGVPGIRFANDEDTGLYRIGANIIGVAVNGGSSAAFRAEGLALGSDLSAFSLGGVSIPNYGIGYNSATIYVGGFSGLVFHTGQVERMRINGSGNVGIGTSSPGARLHNYYNFGTQSPASLWRNAIFQSDYTRSDNSQFVGRRVSTGVLSYSSVVQAEDSAGAVTSLAVNPIGGNVGIGIIDPSHRLHVGGNLAIAADGSNYMYVGRFNAGYGGSVINTLGGSSFIVFQVEGLDRLKASSTYVNPGADNVQSLGTSGVRWSVVYAATGSINTSDERAKQDITPIPDEWLDAWADVDWKRYKFIDAVQAKGDEARWHVGLIAQHVRDAFASRDLDARAIGLLCYDEWEEEREPIFATVTKTRMVERQEPRTRTVQQERQGFRPIDPNDPESLFEPFTETIEVEETYFETVEVEEEYEVEEDTGETRVTLEAGDRWGLRYDECQTMEAAWQRRELARKDAALQSMGATIATLSARLSALEGA
jgi:hypothetical protein